MKIVKLKNGSTELEVAVQATMLNLRALDPVAIIELVSKARDSGYQLYGNAQVRLQKRGLVQKDGTIHETIKNVVLSAFEGEGLEMTFSNPRVD